MDVIQHVFRAFPQVAEVICDQLIQEDRRRVACCFGYNKAKQNCRAAVRT
jgi:hypothetical protein